MTDAYTDESTRKRSAERARKRRKRMDLQIKYWTRGIEPELDSLILDFFKNLGYECYGTGYDLHDKYREMVFNHKSKKSGGE